MNCLLKSFDKSLENTLSKESVWELRTLNYGDIFLQDLNRDVFSKVNSIFELTPSKTERI